jgi:hypothetical protein
MAGDGDDRAKVAKLHPAIVAAPRAEVELMVLLAAMSQADESATASG